MKDLTIEMLSSYLINSPAIDESKICMGIRSRLTTLTKDYNWGVLSGQYFGYNLNQSNAYTKVIVEYEIYYNQTQCFHVLIYNKEGDYNLKFGGLVNKARRKNFNAIQPIILCLVILGYMWLNSACKGKKTGALETVCEYKVSLVVTISLGIILLLIGIRYGSNGFRRHDYTKLKTS